MPCEVCWCHIPGLLKYLLYLTSYWTHDIVILTSRSVYHGANVIQVTHDQFHNKSCLKNNFQNCPMNVLPLRIRPIATRREGGTRLEESGFSDADELRCVWAPDVLWHARNKACLALAACSKMWNHLAQPRPISLWHSVHVCNLNLSSTTPKPTIANVPNNILKMQLF